MIRVVILAGGIGSRVCQVSRPKQFVEIYGKPLIIYTLETFEVIEEVEEITIVCNKEWIEQVNRWVRKYDITKVKYIIEGGMTRQESSYEAIKLLETMAEADDIIIIHDVARPLVNKKIILNNIQGTLKYGAVDTVISATDTIVKSNQGIYIDEIPKRIELYIGQTPQSFIFSTIKKAHHLACEEGVKNATDDCQLLLRQGIRVALVEGDRLNFKITTKEDFRFTI